jgi:hypothetical protein
MPKCNCNDKYFDDVAELYSPELSAYEELVIGKVHPPPPRPNRDFYIALATQAYWRMKALDVGVEDHSQLNLKWPLPECMGPTVGNINVFFDDIRKAEEVAYGMSRAPVDIKIEAPEEPKTKKKYRQSSMADTFLGRSSIPTVDFSTTIDPSVASVPIISEQSTVGPVASVHPIYFHAAAP